jgi:hypothetical protein
MGLTGAAGDPRPERVAVIQRGRVLPAFPEAEGQVPDRWPAQLQLDVVPGRPGPVLTVHLDRLGVALMPGVVAAAMGEVDAAGEGHVLVGVGPVHQDQLLVMGAGAADPLVEQDLAPGLVDHVPQMQVLALAERLAEM